MGRSHYTVAEDGGVQVFVANLDGIFMCGRSQATGSALIYPRLGGLRTGRRSRTWGTAPVTITGTGLNHRSGEGDDPGDVKHGEEEHPVSPDGS
jgi:hypothetical protein